MNNLHEGLSSILKIEKQIEFIRNFENRDKNEMVSVGDLLELIDIMKQVYQLRK